MKVRYLNEWTPMQDVCGYPDSKLSFRGPRRNLKRDYIACLGGTETFGRFVNRPFPQALEDATGQTCVNLGWPNAGVDVLCKDAGLRHVAKGAKLVVLQVPCAVNLTNWFYTVHPRRNDRFVAAREPLKALFPEVDFTEFNFVRHMLLHLRSLSVERFVQVHAELAVSWINGMQAFVQSVDCPVVLFWFSDRRPEHRSNDPGVNYDPALVTRSMLDALTSDVAELVEYETSYLPHADQREQVGPHAEMSNTDIQAASALPGQKAHHRAAKALLPVVTRLINVGAA